MTSDVNPVLAWTLRGGQLEARHRGTYVVVGRDGIVESAGALADRFLPRSSLKPLQLLTLFASGEPDRLGLSNAQKAVLLASHSGDEKHVAAVRSVLAKAGIDEAALGCGPHEPIDTEACARLHERGETVARIHNNCSGKHTGFLIRSRMLGAPLSTYLDPTHPVQQEVRDRLREIAGVELGPEDAVFDGCGAPMYPLHIEHMAAAFRDLVNPERLPAALRRGAETLFAAVQAEPHYLAGRGRFDTGLIRAGGGRLLGKCGAEGFFVLGVRDPDRPLGIAVKIDDGSKRGYETFLARFLVQLRVLDGTEAGLSTFLAGRIQNTQGRDVGEIRTIADPTP